MRRSSSAIKNEIEKAFGFFPPFFEPALPHSQSLENLRHQTKFAYVENPIPAVFKEKLAALLARYCSVPYCLLCHSSSLRPLGMKSSEILQLLQMPALSFGELAEKTNCLSTEVLENKSWPDHGSHLEECVLYCSIAIFLSQDTERCLEQLRGLLSPEYYGHLVLFIAYNRTALQWAEAHPELSAEADQRVKTSLGQMLEEEPELSEFFRNYYGRVKEQGDRRTFWLTQEYKKLIEEERRQRANSERNESLVRGLLESTAEGIWGVDLEGAITFINSSALRLLGLESDAQVIGRKSNEFMRLANSHDLPRKHEDPILEAVRSGEPRSLEEEVTRSTDQKSFSAVLNIVPLATNGRILGGVVTITDSTERRTMLQELKLNESWLKATLQGIGDAVIATDTALPPTITFLNGVAEELTGWTNDDAKGKPVRTVFNIINEKTREAAFDPIAKVLATGRMQGLANHTVLIRRDAREFVIEDSAAPIKNSSGAISGVVLVFRDVTNQKRLEREREEAIKFVELERARLNGLFEQMSAPVALLTGPDHVFTFTNPAYRDMLIGGREVVGLTVAEALPEVVSQGFSDLLDGVFTSGRRYVGSETSINLVQRDGTQKRFSLNFVYEPVRNQKGDVEGILVVVQDVTEQVTARARLQESEENLKLAIRGGKLGIWSVSTHDGKLRADDVTKAIHGILLDEDAQAVIARRTHPDDRERVRLAFQSALTEGAIYDIEYRMRQADGSYRWVYTRGEPLRDEAGEILSVSGVVSDITEQKVAEEALRTVERRFHFGTEETGIGVFEMDLVTGESWRNLAHDKIYGRNELMDIFRMEDALKIIHPDDGERFVRELNTAIETRGVLTIECRVVWPDESVHWMFATGRPIEDDRGRPIKFVGTTQDITERVLARQRLLEATEGLAKAKEDADSANQTKSSFLANMSHEIRTPLGVIIGYAELLREPGVEESDRGEIVDVISRNAKSLTRVIDDILDLSKVEAGQLQIELNAMNLGDLLKEILFMFRDRARATGLELSSSIDDNVPLSIRSDVVRLRQILINIVGNAIKFTETGGVYLQASSHRTSAGRSRFDIIVRDTGRGLSSEQQAKLFKPFTQADSTTTREFGGTGLGLVLSKKLANALGGDVTIGSCAPGEGCSFVISFAADEVKAERVYEGLSGKPRSSLARLEGLKILLVEDSTDNQVLIRRVLVRNGASVTIAENGKEGVGHAVEGHFDVVLMDIQMPVMDGYYAMENLKKVGYEKPVIALTAHAMEEERRKTRLSGFAAHVTKPIEFPSLIETIETVVSQREGDP